MKNRRYIKITTYSIQVVIPRLYIEKAFSRAGRNFEAALVEAEAFRDAVLFQHGQMSLLKNIPHLNARGGNSPLAGVFLSVQERDSGQKPKAYFSALYTKADGTPGKKTFGIAKIGSYQKAFHEAAAFRVKMCNLPIDVDSLVAPKPSIVQYLIIKNLADDIPNPLP